MINENILKKLGNISVLLVEDDENTRLAIAQSLQIYCKNIQTAKGGMEGFEKFLQRDRKSVV